MNTAVGLYLHIPFCKAKCHYCDFSSFAGKEDLIDSYLNALRQEMRSRAGFSLSSIFIGGGTPTFLSNEQWKTLLGDLQRLFHFTPDMEFTVEANPETLSPGKARILREGGVNRMSLGLQTTDDRLLKEIGRIHNFLTFQRAIRASRAAGFNNLNADIIYGLPGQSLTDWQETLKRTVDFNLEHVSTYALTIENNTAFGQSGVTTNPDLQADMYQWAHDFLETHGYNHYEISNFAKPGCECRHNLLYWENKDYIAAGCSAAGLMNGERWQNDPTLEGSLDKMKRIGNAIVHREHLKGPDKTAENLILQLRLSKGLHRPLDNHNGFDKVLINYMENGLLENQMGRIVPTLRGWLLSNRIFRDLLIAAEQPA